MSKMKMLLEADGYVDPNEPYICELRIIRINTPVVQINNTIYEFPTMRDGRAFNIINHCLLRYPNKIVRLGRLKTELKECGAPIAGITNIKSALQHSVFDSKARTLGLFVTVTSQAIQVANKLELDAVYTDIIRRTAIQSYPAQYYP